MLDSTLLGSIARQLMSADEVEAEGRRLRVRHTSKQGLRTVTFAVGGREYTAIEQNPDKPSRGVNLPAVATRSSSSRICRQTGSWRSLWMARLRSTAGEADEARLPPIGISTCIRYNQQPGELAKKKRI